MLQLPKIGVAGIILLLIGERRLALIEVVLSLRERERRRICGALVLIRRKIVLERLLRDRRIGCRRRARRLLSALYAGHETSDANAKVRHDENPSYLLLR